MARAPTITPQKIAKMREGHEAGLSTREIGENVGVSHVTVQKWLARDAVNGGQKRGSGLATKSTHVDADAATEAMSAPLPRPGDPEALTAVRARHALVYGLLGRLTLAVEREEYPATNWVTLARYADDLARLIAELTPPAPRDPNEDPDVIEAERVLVSRVAKMVADAEAKR